MLGHSFKYGFLLVPHHILYIFTRPAIILSSFEQINNATCSSPSTDE